MGILDTIYQGIARRVAEIMESTEERNRKSYLTRLGNYFAGAQPSPLKVKTGQYDDNLIMNQMGLIVDRSASLLFGPGVEFVLSEGAQETIDEIFRVNKKSLFLHTLGMYGSTFGTAYVKIVPDGIIDPVTGKQFPRLVCLNPELLTIVASPNDMERVEQYIVEWSDGENKWREVTRHADNEQEGEDQPEADTWVVEYYRSEKGRPYELDRAEPWPYPFPPIAHGKNLPSINGVYGVSDIAQVMTPQDKLNFINSNIGKIIRYHAHPKTIGLGMTKNALEKVSMGADDFFTVSSADANVFNLEMQSDLASSRQFAEDIQREIDNISRTVDTSSLKDSSGQLTNFGLRVLFHDALSKNDVKRMLYGELLEDIIFRLLVLSGAKPELVEIEWGDALPANEVENAQMVRDDFAAGLIDLETAIRRRGYDPEEILPKIQAEKAAKENAGSLLLSNFFAGRQ